MEDVNKRNKDFKKKFLIYFKNMLFYKNLIILNFIKKNTNQKKKAVAIII